jgi:hypothetical protein
MSLAVLAAHYDARDSISGRDVTPQTTEAALRLFDLDLVEKASA